MKNKIYIFLQTGQEKKKGTGTGTLRHWHMYIYHRNFYLGKRL